MIIDSLENQDLVPLQVALTGTVRMDAREPVSARQLVPLVKCQARPVAAGRIHLGTGPPTRQAAKGSTHAQKAVAHNLHGNEITARSKKASRVGDCLLQFACCMERTRRQYNVVGSFFI